MRSESLSRKGDFQNQGAAERLSPIKVLRGKHTGLAHHWSE